MHTVYNNQICLYFIKILVALLEQVRYLKRVIKRGKQREVDPEGMTEGKELPTDDEMFIITQKSEKTHKSGSGSSKIIGHDTTLLDEDCFYLKTPDFLSDERIITPITPLKPTGLKVRISNINL